MDGMKLPASITFTPDTLTIDGIQFSLMVIPQILYEITHPDPRKWYRLERIGDVIHVEVRITEPDNGEPRADAGSSSEGVRQQGQETQRA